MKNRVRILLASAAIHAGLAAAQEVQVVEIGIVGPLSGPQAHSGKDNENGARLAVEDLNAKRLTIGGKKIRFELESEDDAADPRQATTVAQMLCDRNVSGVIGHFNSGTTIPASRVYNECGVPNITVSATNPQLTKAGYKTTFRMVASDDELGARMARYAASRKFSRLAVVDDRTAGGNGPTEAFKKNATALGMSIVSQEYTTDKATDFSAILTSIKAARPDAIFVGVLDTQGGPMLRQMEQLGMADVAVLGTDGICTNKLGELAAHAKTLANVVCSEGGKSLDTSAAFKAWRQRYDARYPQQFQLYSTPTYDAVMVLADSMMRAGSADPKVYASALSSTDYIGITGRIRFAANGEIKDPATTLFVFRDSVKTSADQ